MTQLWTILSDVTGEVLCPTFTTDSFGQHPKDKGWPWDAATQTATRIDAPADTASQLWDGGAWVPDLAALRARAAEQIDAEAEKVRSRFLTPGAGQALTYQRKEAEARAVLDDTSASTPFLTAEAAAREMTVAALAAEVVAQADAWVIVGAAIEGLRMGAKAQIGAADTPEAIAEATTINWPG